MTDRERFDILCDMIDSVYAGEDGMISSVRMLMNDNMDKWDSSDG